MVQKAPLPPDVVTLVQDVREYVRFLETLGVTHIGGAAPCFRSDWSDPNPVSVPAEVIASSDPPATLVNPIKDVTPVMPKKSDPPLLSVPPKPVRQQSTFFDFGGESVTSSEVICQDKSLSDIRQDIGDCQRCKLSETRQKIVFGDGSATAELVFVGEGPGADEDATGIPFVGRAGQLLNKIIEAIGLKREDVYICNVVKCRPPGNRDPEKDEVAACSGFLHRQLAVLKPKVIVALGAPAAFTLLGNSRLGRISDIRGRFYDYRGTPLMVTFHPAYLLRTPSKKREVWEDMKQVRARLRETPTPDM